MPGYSLVPVDYQRDFSNFSLVPVEALAGRQQPGQTSEPASTGGVSGVTQPVQPHPQTQPQQPATGAGQPGVNGPATGNSPSGSGGGAGVGNAGSDLSNPIWAQGWSPESAAFDGYANPTPTQPLTDDQLALLRQKIVEAAQKQIGSPAWDFNLAKGTYPEGTDKCNLFVYEMLTGAGARPGPPTAGDTRLVREPENGQIQIMPFPDGAYLVRTNRHSREMWWRRRKTFQTVHRVMS
jgi:hypothetical protein